MCARFDVRFKVAFRSSEVLKRTLSEEIQTMSHSEFCMPACCVLEVPSLQPPDPHSHRTAPTMFNHEQKELSTGSQQLLQRNRKPIGLLYGDQAQVRGVCVWLCVRA